MGARLELGRRKFRDIFVDVLGQLVDFLGGVFICRASLLSQVRKVGEPIPHVEQPRFELLELLNFIRTPGLVPWVRLLAVRCCNVAYRVLERGVDYLLGVELLEVDNSIGLSCKTSSIKVIYCMLMENMGLTRVAGVGNDDYESYDDVRSAVEAA